MSRVLRADPAVVTPLHLELMRQVGAAERDYGDLDLRLEGGTALAAYHLKHRRSEDLDFFAHHEMDARDFSAFVAERLRQEGRSVQSLRANRGFAELLITGNEGQDPIRLEFGRTSPFELAPPDGTPEGIRVASYRDLCAGKLHAVCDRYEPKDFIDLHAILRRPGDARTPGDKGTRGSFLDLLADLERSDPGLGPAQVGEALARGVGHDIVGEFPLRMLVPISTKEVRETIRMAIAECARLARERAGWSSREE
ncbi:MAG: nucleotidyl transferase AbiEii/AbiGii toxin family protein [Gemmatimonadota bacterium]